MSTRLRGLLLKAAICALLVTTATEPARANSIPTKSDVVWIGVAIAAIGAGIGIGVYAAVHHGHTISGCAFSGPNGIELRSGGDGQVFSLTGETAAIRPGERVRVSGSKVKHSAGGDRQFTVDRITRDYGACKAPSAP